MNDTPFTLPEGHTRLSQADLNRFTFDTSGALHVNGKRVETVLRLPFLERFWGRVVATIVLVATAAAGLQSGFEVFDRLSKGSEAVVKAAEVPMNATCHPVSNTLIACQVQAFQTTPTKKK